MMSGSRTLTVAMLAPIGAETRVADAVLLSAVLDFRHLMGDRLARLLLISDEPERLKWLLPPDPRTVILRYSRALLLNPRLWVYHPDVVVLLGDDLLTERPRALDLFTLSSLTTTLRMMGARLVFYANQAETLSPAKRALADSILMRADLIMLASPEAVVQLKRQGVQNEVFCTASPVCSLPPASPEVCADVAARLHLNTHKRPVFTLVPREFFTWGEAGRRNWSLRAATSSLARESHTRFCRQMAAYADWLSQFYDGNVILLAIGEQDELVIHEIYEHMTQRYRARLILERTYHPHSISALLALTSLQVTTRPFTLHMAAKSGTLSIGLKGAEGMEGIFRQMGLTEYLIDYATFPNRVPNTYKLDEQLCDLTQRAITAGDTLREQMRKGGESLHKRALSNRVYLREWLERCFYDGSHVLEPGVVEGTV